MSRILRAWQTSDGAFFENDLEAIEHQKCIDIAEVLKSVLGITAEITLPIPEGVKVAKELMKRVVIHFPPECASE